MAGIPEAQVAFVTVGDWLQVGYEPDVDVPELHTRLAVGCQQITLSGELDLATVAPLGELMALLIQLNPGDQTIDISSLSFIDAAGLGCLVNISNQLSAQGAQMHVVGVTPRLQRVFDIGGVSGLLGVKRPTQQSSDLLWMRTLEEEFDPNSHG